MKAIRPLALFPAGFGLLRARPRVHQGPLHQVRIHDSHARREKAVHLGVCSEGHLREISHHARPHAVQRGALRRRQLQGQPGAFGEVRARRIHLRVPGCARPLHVGRRIRGHAAADRREARAPGRGRELRCLRHHRLADQERAQSQREGGHVGDLVSGVLHVGGNHRCAPRAQGRVAAGAHRGLVHRRRFSSQRRAVPAARVPLLERLRPSAAGSHASPDAGAGPHRHVGCVQLFPLARPACERQREVLQERRSVLDRDDAARHLRRILAGPQPASAPEEHQAGGDDRGRLVRRGGPVRGAEYLQRDREEQPGRVQHAGHGPVVPRLLGAHRRRRAGQRAVRRQDLAVLPGRDRVSVLRTTG